MRGPNMSYCAFENTTLAMEQLIEMLRDAQEESVRDFVNKMNRNELQAFRDMYETCERLREELVAAQDQCDEEERAYLRGELAELADELEAE